MNIHQPFYARHLHPASRGQWASVPDEKWNSWIWQQQNRLISLEEFDKAFQLSPEEKDAFARCSNDFRAACTPYYAALAAPCAEDGTTGSINFSGSDSSASSKCPIRQQIVPAPAELQHHPGDQTDPLSEELQSPVAGLVHRYPDRVLLYTSHNCPVYCRHCTRKRKVGDPNSAPLQDQLQAGLDYIRRTPAVRDVVLSGGDPLTLSDARLANLLDQLFQIPHVELVRVGSRNPVTLPQRITPELAELLGSFPNVQVMTHFNHPKECTLEALEATLRLAKKGVPVWNQSVLLKGVNDKASTIARLNQMLLMMKVRPYYLYQCDQAAGISHFRTRLQEGMELLKQIEGHTSGLAVPHYVLDLPEGKGKVRLNGAVITDAGNWKATSFTGEEVLLDTSRET